MSHTTEHHKKEAKKYWDEQLSTFEKIKEKGNIAQYIHGFANLENAFRGDDLSVCCIDEGTPYGCMRFAGSLILHQDKAEKFSDVLKIAGVKGVYSHAGCGAAGLYAKQNNLDLEKADEYGIIWAKKFADILNVSYKGHIGSEGSLPMKRPAGFHVARVIYYDGTGRFNPDNAMGLPQGFVISRRYHINPADALEEVKIAISIATGDHGFGDLISGESPLFVIPVGDSGNTDFSLDILKSELNTIRDEYGEKIVIDGFIAHV